MPIAVAAATRVAGATCVDANVAPLMGSEDFGVLLQQVPGNLILIGNGDTPEKGDIPLRNALYDFNDDIFAPGATYFAQVVKEILS